MFKTREVWVAAVSLFLLALVVYFLPNMTLDPWNIFNPRKFSALVLSLATLEFFGYVVARLIGERRSLLLVGFLGGLVSSTAVLVSSARQAAKYHGRWRNLLRAALAAKVASIFALLLIVALVSESLFENIVWPVMACSLVGVFQLILLSRKKDPHPTDIVIKSPLDWIGVLRLSLLLAGILALLSLSKFYFGESASMALSFVSGLFELQGVALANATLYDQGQIVLQTASFHIVLAIIASLVAKAVMAWVLCGTHFARSISLIFGSMALVLGLTHFILR